MSRPILSSPSLRASRRSVALVITLAFLAILSVMVVGYLSSTSSDRIATASYGKSVEADQLAIGALHLVVGELKKEMEKDALPDTGGGSYPSAPIFTNVTSQNVSPQLVGTNAVMPSLVKVSTGVADFTGTLANGTLLASTNSASSTSLNGRSVSLARWNQACLGAFPNTSSLPCWVLVTRAGPTNTASFGASGSTANNAAPGNNGYVIGRFAYAIYDEGGLLDINDAGGPSSLTMAQINQVKRTLAGADLTAVGMSAAQVTSLIAWRNQASSTAFLNYVTNFAVTNGIPGGIYPGDNAFLSRQDLIQAALNGNAGLTTNMLPYLTTFTREPNSPSWSPAVPSGSSASYAATALSINSTNVFLPLVRRTGITDSAAHALTTYLPVPGSPTTVVTATYSVEEGYPLVQRRFPLDCLLWLGPNGPGSIAGGNASTSAALAQAIQARFGLVWANSSTLGTMVWQYVGPSGSTELSKIETLAQVAAEPIPREPNFFELLQAGILSGSLAIPAALSTSAGYPFINARLVQQDAMTQVLRIGASILNQYASDAMPRVIEYKSSQNGNVWSVAGAVNLPYINMFAPAASGLSPNDSGPASTYANVDRYMASYLMLQLWNPTQQGTTAPTRPNVRIRLQGQVVEASGWAYPGGGQTRQTSFTFTNNVSPYGLTVSLGSATTLQLSTAGVAGFTNSAMPTAAMVQSAPSGIGTTTGQQWALTPTSGISPYSSSTAYVAYRLPDLHMTFTNAPAYDASGSTAHVLIGLSRTGLSPFQLQLEYQDGSGNWIPYQYWTGNGDSATWISPLALWSQAIAGNSVLSSNAAVASTVPITPYPLSDLLSLGGVDASVTFTSDPRSIRFNPVIFTQDNLAYSEPGIITNAYAIWPTAPKNATYFKTTGYGGFQDSNDSKFPANLQQVPPLFSSGSIPWYSPALLCRNNSGNTGTANAPTSGYVDAYGGMGDGIARIGDSGLFIAGSAATSGNPYARILDRPIILNRPFNGVGELGYTFRDDPWRSLDFFTSNSADAGLLDLFTMDDSARPWLSGRVNLNTRVPQVLQALLNNTAILPLALPLAASGTIGGGNTNLTSALAQDIVAATAVTPLVNKSQLATTIGPQLPASVFSSTDEQYVKYQREAFVRALADAGQTRTWNLMIDLVAQTGRYPAAATSLDQFSVEGEKRYWLHVSIDRFTGQVIDEQVEAVSQ